MFVLVFLILLGVPLESGPCHGGRLTRGRWNSHTFVWAGFGDFAESNGPAAHPQARSNRKLCSRCLVQQRVRDALGVPNHEREPRARSGDARHRLNAQHQARRTAGSERTLSAVACIPLLDSGSPDPFVVWSPSPNSKGKAVMSF